MKTEKGTIPNAGHVEFLLFSGTNHSHVFPLLACVPCAFYRPNIELVTLWSLNFVTWYVVCQKCE